MAFSDDFLENIDPDQNYFNNSADISPIESNYISVENFNCVTSKDPPRLLILNYNIRSFNANIDCFLCSFKPEKLPDVFVFTETWLTPTDTPVIEGYKSFHTFRPHGRSGGVSIFVKNFLRANQVKNISVANTNIESCSVEISSSTSPVIITGINRPHSGTILNFNSELSQIMNNRSLDSKTSILLGDFNINLFIRLRGN